MTIIQFVNYIFESFENQRELESEIKRDKCNTINLLCFKAHPTFVARSTSLPWCCHRYEGHTRLTPTSGDSWHAQWTSTLVLCSNNSVNVQTQAQDAITSRYFRSRKFDLSPCSLKIRGNAGVVIGLKMPSTAMLVSTRCGRCLR